MYVAVLALTNTTGSIITVLVLPLYGKSEELLPPIILKA